MKTLIRITDILLRILFWVVVVTACCALFSCRTVQYVPVENTHTSETEKHNVERDSIHVHDSIYIYMQGDTVHDLRWKTIYKEIFRTDTFIVERTDTINTIVEIEKKLTKWQQTKMDIGAGVLYAVPILIAVGLFILYRKFKK